MNVPPAAPHRVLLPLLLLALAGLAGCERSSSGFDRDPKKYPVAFDFGYDRPQPITEEEVKAVIAVFEKYGVKADMKLNNKVIKPDASPAPTGTPVPKPSATSTPTPSPTPPPMQTSAGWKTQVCGLLQAATQEDLNKALTEYLQKKDDGD